MKILFLSMHYAPEPCDSRTSRLAGLIAARGHRAQALTSFPNYPFGKVYDGYRQRLCEKETIDGVEVVRIPMFPDHSLSRRRRALSYLSFGASATFLGGLFTRRPDVLWIHHPPLTTALAGWILAKVKRAPYVLEIHDLWPETLTSTGMVRPGRLTRAIRRICDFLHAGAAAIVVTSPGMKRNLVGHGTDADKIHVFSQFADAAAFRPVPRDTAFGERHALAEGRFNVVFAGNLGPAQALDTVIEAARLLSDLPRVQFVILGDGVDRSRLAARAEEAGLSNVRFLGHHPALEMPSFFAWADALLIHLKDDPLFAITVPSKTQAYMASARPILCGVSGDTAEMVASAQAGLTFPPENAVELAAAVRRLVATAPERRDAMGRAGRSAVLNEASIESLAPRYEELFIDVATRRKTIRPAPVPSPAAVESTYDR